MTEPTDQPTEAEKAELERRWREHEADPDAVVSWDAIKQRLSAQRTAEDDTVAELRQRSKAAENSPGQGLTLAEWKRKHFGQP